MRQAEAPAKKRRWLTIAVVIVAVAAVAGGIWAYIANRPKIGDALTDGDFQYRLLEDDTVSLVKYTGNDLELTLPDRLGGKPVTAVEGLALSWQKTLTAVTVPEGIVTLGNGVFYNCTSLKEVTLPASLKILPEDAFYNCISLTDVHVAGSNERLQDLDGILFDKAGTTLLRYPAGRQDAAYAVPEGVITVGAGAFENAEALQSISLPATLTAIGDNAFYFCGGLMDITLPESLRQIGAYAFANCEQLPAITLPEGITRLADSTFYNCSALLTVKLPATLTAIEQYAFRTCMCLDDVELPAGVTTIGDGAFMECTSLTRLTVPEGVTALGEYTFGYCIALEEVDIPASVTTIHQNAFSACNEDAVLVCDSDCAAFTHAAEIGLDVKLRDTGEVIHNEKPEED